MVSGGGKRAKDRGAGAATGGTATAALPPSRQLVWHSSFDHARSRHAALVRGHALCQQLEVVLPSAHGAALAGALQWETGFFYELTAPLALLLSPRFIAEYVVDGALYMVAKCVAADAHNSAMVLPSGELLLLVDSETYEQLGLVGHKYAQSAPAAPAKSHGASSASRRGQRYVVSIDLTSKAFTDEASTSAYRARVVHCLATKFEPLEMLLCAYNARGAPRTITFGDDDSIERKRVEVNGAHERLREIFVPALDRFFHEKTSSADAKMEMATLRASLESVYDWLGVVACRLTDLLQQMPLEEYVSTFDGRVPDGIATDANSEVSVVTWRGMLGAEFTQRVLDRVRESVAAGTIPWAAVSVWGFPDTLVSWRQEYEVPLSRAQEKKQRKQHARDGDDAPPLTTATETVDREHGYLLNGNNNYTFLLLPKHEYFVLQELGPHDATM